MWEKGNKGLWEGFGEASDIFRTKLAAQKMATR